ncbi:hypothetical protein LSTR_LSTR013976 [Laodelphax striatellus]|uniref:Uncharacterized protein n=1 Tax=Laodelphax striatellus TaxID=195883 RepID=A0A482X3N4_LAOST|nr:hypothetical protein LSTR_LSTR013976 [Laodelphax striatellus]
MHFYANFREVHIYAILFQSKTSPPLPGPPWYEWSLQPAIKYNMPHIPHPFYQRDPQQQHMSVLVPMKLFGVQNFPPVLERLIQMVQNHYSVYNNPDTLIIPPIPGSNKPYFYEKPTIPFEPAMMGGAEQGTGVPMMGGEQEIMGENNQTMGETEQEAGDKTETTTTVPEEGLIDERFGNSGSSSASTEKPSESSTSMMETTEEMPASTTMKAEDEKMVDGEGAATTASTTEGKEKEETTVSEETSTTSSSSSETTMTESEQMESTTTTETAESTTEKATLEPMN